MKDEERLFDARIRGDTEDDAVVEECVSEGAEECLRRISFGGPVRERAFDAFRRVRQDSLQPFEGNPGRERSGIPAQGTTVHENDPGPG